MTLFHATTTTRGEAAAQALSEALDALEPAPSATGVHDRDDGSGIWEVGAYFDGRPDAARLALLAAAQGAPDFALAPVGSRDWLAQVRAGLTPVEAGRFVVYGSHDRARIPSNRVGLEIEAALAFGTGHHESTRGCLLALDGLARAGWGFRNVADIGCGTGVLAMAAARVWPCRATASDMDALAVETARANIAANRLGGRILCATATGFAAPVVRARGPYDLLLANILAGPLRRLAPEMARNAAPGAVLVLSGILTRQAAGVEAVYRGWGFARRRRHALGSWSTLVLTAPA
ncbi:MAG TPA: 50S ribosomal protein L11 methyltransferase [Amaricoccus sp.]|uniref:50S ribosomal protein L11 methyltransferase n=1 Tax=Amaricoccus sp. TaxID=1872485 RepID=UPI002B92137D|nr:50S ribosomal protein L11 methyltransferase [Amaricoccus sp.]HMQ95454.1 50S ribosomal protein L11 methyltransferase [Amaricoccus sp.]HMR52733.1 50S ribosomal protein L11 methyltransferase [Amaricoccus sp.]HMR61411.1 50S ribosomal protein L11 methyltransferase [Amaricoccus sp.]HMT99636.1 50S ribosomal protein L11 methyltransferase [Amaricoccus sp.]